jgi:predicted amidohydrolase
MRIKAAAIQMWAQPFAVDENLAKAEALVREAGLQGAELVVLPELFNTGYAYTDRLLDFAEPLDGKTGLWLKGLSQAHGIHLAGSFLAREDGHFYDVLMLASPEGQTWVYRKVHVALMENLYFERGHDVCVAETILGRVGLLLCFDLMHAGLARHYQGQVDIMLISSAPPNLAAAQLGHGEEIVLYAKDTPLWAPMAEIIHNWYAEEGPRQHALSLDAPVIHACMCGYFEGSVPTTILPFLGFSLSEVRKLRSMGNTCTGLAPFVAHSAIFARDGRVLDQLPEGEGIAIAEVEVRQGDASHLAPIPHGRYLVPGADWRVTLAQRAFVSLGGILYRRKLRRMGLR